MEYSLKNVTVGYEAKKDNTMLYASYKSNLLRRKYMKEDKKNA